MSIISHKHKFIFIKTRKTAGTSVSASIAGLCGDNDVLALSQDVVDLTKIERRNIELSPYKMGGYLLARHIYGVMQRVPSVITGRRKASDIGLIPTFRQHMTASEIKSLIGDEIWNSYYKFTIERNPYDRLVSFYKWRSHRFGLDCSFEDFALSALKYNRKYKFAAHGFSNVPFYSLDGSSLCVDRVVKFENLENELRIALSEAGLDDATSMSLPNLKSGIRAGDEYKEFYSEDLLKLAKERFVLEEKVFGYKF